MPARASEPSPSTTSRRARAPRAWPRAPGAIPRPSWVGGTPITPRVLTRSVFAAPAADPPLRSDRGGASRRRLRRPAYDRAQAVREVAGTLDITLMPLPGYSPDLMPVEALWRWLREDVTYHHCHASADDLTRRVADFEVRINQDPCALADRLWVKDCIDPEEEKLRFSN